MPTIITRLADETGCSICGGLDTFGSAAAPTRRSGTTWRALSIGVPGSKIISIDDRPGIDRDRIDCIHATPLSRSCSRGTVMSCSTSAADSPRASVCTSTVVGVNSGSTSVFIVGNCHIPSSSNTNDEPDD